MKLTIDDYIINEQGDVFNKHTGHKLKPQLNGKGYLRVGIGGKLCFVHRLVAEKYIPNPKELPQVNHKDGNKLNNCVNNLEWCTNFENRKHAVQNNLHLIGDKCSWAKLTEKDAIEILKNKTTSSKILAQKYNVSRGTIEDIKHYRTWKHLKRYADL